MGKHLLLLPKPEPQVSGTSALADIGHGGGETGDKATHLHVECAENGWVLHTEYLDGDERALVFGPGQRGLLLAEIARRL